MYSKLYMPVFSNLTIIFELFHSTQLMNIRVFNPLVMICSSGKTELSEMVQFSNLKIKNHLIPRLRIWSKALLKLSRKLKI